MLRQHKTYELVCRLEAHEALERIKTLLSKERVQYKAADLSVTSTQTPIFMARLELGEYRRRNWTGLNPFAFVSAVDVRCEPGDSGVTKVIVRVNRFPAFVWVAWWVMISLLAAFSMSQPTGAIFFVVGLCISWFATVSFLGGYLIKKEIDDYLNDEKLA